MSWRGEARHARGAFWVRTSPERERPVPPIAAGPRRTGRCRPGPITPAPGRFPGLPHATLSPRRPRRYHFLALGAAPALPRHRVRPARPGPAAPSAAGHQENLRDAAGHHGTRSPRRAAVRTPPARLDYKSQSASRVQTVRYPATRNRQAPTNPGVLGGSGDFRRRR